MAEGPRHYSPYDAPMWDSITERQMKLQRCSSCGAFRYPPGPACHECLSTDSEWVALAGKGKLLSWTVFHRQYLPAYPPPSVVIAVKLEEGPIMVSNIDADAAPKLKIDQDVVLVYAEHPDGYMLPRFELAKPA